MALPGEWGFNGLDVGGGLGGPADGRKKTGGGKGGHRHHGGGGNGTPITPGSGGSGGRPQTPHGGNPGNPGGHVGGGNGNGSGGNGGGNGGNGGNTDPWGSQQQSAFDQMESILQEYGLGDLSDYLKQLIIGGTTDAASLQLALQQTDTWKRRFAGNEILRQNGLGVLSPAEYLATERQYAQIMKNYGLPKGFYDDPTDFAKFIGNSVSVNELQQRVSEFSDLANREDPSTVAQLNSMGLSRGDLLAYMMDPGRAAPIIQQTYQTALLGSAARRSGVVADNGYLSQLAAQGVSEQQASQGYGLIAGSLADAKTLSGIYGEHYGLNDMQNEIFQNDGNAAKKRKRLASQERANFSGSAGVGSLTQNSAGSY